MLEEDKLARRTLQPKSTVGHLGVKKLSPGLRVDTKGSKPLYRWNVVRSKAQAPSTRSHCVSFVYNDWYVCGAFSFHVLGGEDLQDGLRKDFYRYTFKTPESDPGWTKLQLKGTFPSSSSLITIDGAAYSSHVECEGTLYLFGGVSQTEPNNDLHTISLETLDCAKAEQKGYWPPPVASHTAVFNPDTKKMYVYGGLARYKTSANVYELDVVSMEWRRIEAQGPAPRSSHAAVFYQGTMVVFGGKNVDGDMLGDLWELNLTDFTWKKHEFGEVAPKVNYKINLATIRPFDGDQWGHAVCVWWDGGERAGDERVLEVRPRQQNLGRSPRLPEAGRPFGKKFAGDGAEDERLHDDEEQEV